MRSLLDMNDGDGHINLIETDFDISGDEASKSIAQCSSEGVTINDRNANVND